MIKNRNSFKKKVIEANEKLRDIIEFLQKENKDGKQFDYVNTPSIETISILSKANEINRIWYQEGGK